MRVVVNEKYTYECSFKVRVGDKVKLPKGMGPHEWVGTITAIGSPYTGAVKDVIEIVERAPVDPKYNKYGFRSIHEPWEPGLKD
jgi:hypothetical protein